MLDDVSHDNKLSKRDYKQQLPDLQARLHDLQRAFWRQQRSAIVVVEGWDLSGKGSVINKLTERLEPRGFVLHVTRQPRSTARQMPWMWRFWQVLPKYGRMAIFDRSWYAHAIEERIAKRWSKKQWRRACDDILGFEQMLIADRYLVIKIFLHISREELQRRTEALTKDPLESWRVKPRIHAAIKNFDRLVPTISATLEATHHDAAPWEILGAADERWTRIRVFQALIDRLENAIENEEVAHAG